MKKNYRDGFDIEALAEAIRRGEHFDEVKKNVDFTYNGKALPTIEKKVSYVITDEFIEANLQKLIQLNIVKA